MAPKKKTDMGAAFTGLILGGSVLFLVMLTIVWLTNRSFAGKKEHEATTPPAAGAPTPPLPPAVPPSTP